MLLRSHSDRRPLPGLSALLTHSTPLHGDATSPPPPPSLSPRGSMFTPVSLTSPPYWMTQALSSLERGERELLSLRERQQAEVEEVNRELDNAVIQAQRQERRLLEKVEQEYREAQRCLDQVKRENAAAVRVVRSLVDRQLCRMGQLKEQIQRWGRNAGGANKSQLQRGVAEVTQPWEISLSMKRVTFTANLQSRALSLGEVDVHEQGMTYPIGVCGVQGQKCALHSGDIRFTSLSPAEMRKDPPSTVAGHRQTPGETKRTNSGNTRVVRKLRLSSSGEKEEELKSPSPGRRGGSESSQDEELESLCSDTQGHDLFLAIPPSSSQGESEGDENDGRQSGVRKRSVLKSQRKQRTLVLVPREEPSCPPEESPGHRPDEGIPPKNTTGGSLSSHSLLDFSATRRPRSLRGPSAMKTPNEWSVDGGSPPSPVGGEDYSYTASSLRDGSLREARHRSVSTADLCGKSPPLTSGSKGERQGIRRSGRRTRLLSEPSTLEQGRGKSSRSGRSPTSSEEREPRPESPMRPGLTSSRVSRSLSTSALEGDGSHQAEEQQQVHRVEGEAVGPALRELGEEDGSTALDSAYLVRRFGKQGSGRTDFNLPSGVHATAKGQLFVVDCGNARVQVTDLQRSVVQQVSPSGSERSARICNYFDVAVNAKGLIALTCAAERALLVFSRHGRLLQTFGGTMIGSTHEELDAPRGVTVTRLDEFLVADIKRGTLTAFNLDPKTGARWERTVVTGFHRPYLVAACLTTGLMAVSERGNETGRVPCVRVLEPGWNTVRILGVCSGLGPVLSCPWGLCIDRDGDVLVADWGKQHHRVVLYPAKGVGWQLVTDDLNSPRGLALLPGGQVVVSDSMNHCIKIYQYK